MDVSNHVLVVFGALLVLVGILLFLHSAKSKASYRPRFTNHWLTRHLEFQLRVFPAMHVLIAAGAFVALGCMIAGVGLGWVHIQ